MKWRENAVLTTLCKEPQRQRWRIPFQRQSLRTSKNYWTHPLKINKWASNRRKKTIAESQCLGLLEGLSLNRILNSSFTLWQQRQRQRCHHDRVVHVGIKMKLFTLVTCGQWQQHRHQMCSMPNCDGNVNDTNKKMSLLLYEPLVWNPVPPMREKVSGSKRLLQKCWTSIGHQVSQ